MTNEGIIVKLLTILLVSIVTTMVIANRMSTPGNTLLIETIPASPGMVQLEIPKSGHTSVRVIEKNGAAIRETMTHSGDTASKLIIQWSDSSRIAKPVIIIIGYGD